MTPLAALAAFVAFVGAAVSPPRDPPPKVQGASTSPPPAWIAVGDRSAWMAYSSYCWTTSCVDFLPPATRPDIPKVAVAAGATVRFHLGFVGHAVRAVLPSGRRVALASGRVIAWRPPARGVVVLEAKGPGGSASYVVRLLAR